MEATTLIMDEKAMNRAIARISYEIIEHNRGIRDLCIVGILSRGAELASRIADKIREVEGHEVLLAQLDITRFRDDKKAVDHIDRSSFDFSIENKKVVLVDDVMYTGRSVRAAIDAILEKGRPQMIELAVLIDRGHRELPIRADFVGKNLPTSREEKVRVFIKPRDEDDRVIIAKEGD